MTPKELQLLTALEEKVDRIERALLANKEMLSIAEVAAYMNVNKQHIYKLVGGEMPRLKSYCGGGKLRFVKKEDLLDFLMQGERMTGAEINKVTDKIAGRR